MSNSITTVLIAASVMILVLFNGFGSAFNIDISPDEMSVLVHNEVSFTCKLDPRDNDVNEIMVLELAKDDVRIAVLRRFSALSVRKDLQSRFQVEGNASLSAVLDSYIRVTLTNPAIKDTGTYTCLVYYLDQFALLKEMRASANLTVADDDLKSAVKYLVDVVSIQGETIEKLKNDLKKEEDVVLIQGETIEKLKNDLKKEEDVVSIQGETIEKLKKQEDEHTVRIDRLNNQIKSQEAEIDNLGRQMMQFNDRDNTTVSFTALHTGTGVFQDGHDLIYSSVVENVGGAYNGQTGVFTAPYTGYYLLHVSLCSSPAKLIYVDLKSSHGSVLTRLQLYDDTNLEIVDTSIVARLEAGVEVKPVIRAVDSGFTLWQLDSPDTLNTYYGYLLKML